LQSSPPGKIAKMSDEGLPGSSEEGPGRERRREDRRQAGHRSESRRPPPPLWRRPAALVAYGALAVLAVFLILQPADSDGVADDESQGADSVATASGRLASATYDATREAFTLAQYEGLIAEGVDAVGEIVRTELYCGSISLIATSEIETPTSVLAPLKDAEGRVAGADCRWSQEARTSDFLLVVPADLAEDFARAPEVDLDFVRRRVIPADVEWLGRTEALSLRTAGVLRNIRN
jgi:hypothetical protein